MTTSGLRGHASLAACYLSSAATDSRRAMSARIAAMADGPILICQCPSFLAQEYFGDADVEVVGSETRTKLEELLFLRRCVFFSGVSVG